MNGDVQMRLHTTTARISGESVNVLFDEGSQVNIIATSIVERLGLKRMPLKNPQDVRFPNNEATRITHFVPNVILTFPGLRLDNRAIRLYFFTTLLVMPTRIDAILGIPFLRYWNIVSHHCNGSLVVTGLSGHHAIIPLHTTRLLEPCRTRYCPIASLQDPAIVTPDYPPFQLPSRPPKAFGQPLLADVQITSFADMIQLASDSPVQLVNAHEYVQLARTPEAALFILVFRKPSDLILATNDATAIMPFAQQVRDFALQQYPSLFPDELPCELPPQDRLQHPIDLLPIHKIPPRELYRQSDDELRETKRQINEYLNAGHIRPSSSSFGAPVLLVTKKDGSMRMCIDYRSLNDITIKNTFPLPRIDDLHDRLGKARFFTKLDLYSGYHQIPIRPGDEHKTAFTSRYGTYEFLVMPFGLTNAPATFQTAMNILFRHWLDDFVTVYLDDILIYSPDEAQHLDHVRHVLDRLQSHKWYCKLKKCDFAATSVEYLGHIVSNGQIAIDPDKMKAVTAWPVPFRNVTEVQSFLGLIGYYRKFIPRFSHIARHLHELTRKDIEFKWENQHTQAVEALKRAIVAPDCLAIFDSALTTILTTDACDYALGAALSQKHPQGDRPVAFISRILNTTERRYSMWEKELFAIVWAIKHFRPYLLNHSFTVKSDNKPSTQMITNSSLKLSTSATNRIIRWILSLQTYSFTVEHQPGTSNVVADALSRFPLHVNAMPDDHINAEFCQLQTVPLSEKTLPFAISSRLSKRAARKATSRSPQRWTISSTFRLTRRSNRYARNSISYFLT